jgi:hypothetical protein
MARTRPDRMTSPPPWAGDVRAAYLRGEPVAAIRVLAGQVSPANIYFWIDRIVATDGTVMRSPVERRHRTGTRDAGGSFTEPAIMPRQDLLNRLWAAAERQMRSIEERFASLEPGDSVGEADAKALGFVARLVKELAALDEINKGGDTNTSGERDDQAEAAQTQSGIAELHAAIARQLAGLDTGATA